MRVAFFFDVPLIIYAVSIWLFFKTPEVDNIGIFVLVKFENKLEIVISEIIFSIDKFKSTSEFI